MGSIETFLPGLAAGSNNVSTGSAVVDGGAELFGSVLTFFGDLISSVVDS